MSTVEIPLEQRFVLYDADWRDYVRIGEVLEERHVRLTYDRGVMEFMTLSPEHERWKSVLARFVEALTEELDIDIASYGSMTCGRETLDRGLEPDESYWIANEPLVRGRNEIDFDRDPPPDLAIEVEISRSALNRMGIYAALRVPEVWRWDGRHLRVFLLGPDGEYAESPSSQSFPFLPIAELTRFLAMSGSLSETKLVRAFRAWVREQIAQGWGRSLDVTQS